ncbi:MAG: hypothetical protein EZS28_017296 [Streblomastix strix]|uniref:protein-tyrosine-phosphatase n=1 Tax=Streblomastix strix TaxID=222440 RepID=A0A5J4VX92_9EUKA|nr:MAG: hypothetical protein EZS28_017296 [Streblomastix strix]
MQFINSQDLFNISQGSPYYSIIFDIRPNSEFDANHVIQSLNLDVSKLNTDISNIKGSNKASIEFLKQLPVWDKIEKRTKLKIFFISDKDQSVFLTDIFIIFTNCISPHRLFALDVDFDSFKQNYPVVCISTTGEKEKENILTEIPNEIIPGLFLGGYVDAEIMLNIIKQLQITHILVCAYEFTPDSDGKALMEYKIPEGIIIHYLDMEDDDDQLIDFEGSFEFIDNALFGQDHSKQSSSSQEIIFLHHQKTLVHCIQGKSRSASVVIGYLMIKFHLTFAKAFEIVFHQRSIISPKFGFVKQLYMKEYELIGKYGEVDQELILLRRNEVDPLLATEITLGKRMNPLISLSDISKLPQQYEMYLSNIRFMYSKVYNRAKYEWEAEKQGKDENIKSEEQ